MSSVGAVVHRRIGIFGGTFDPVHNGHLRTALEVAELLALDELRLVPSNVPPHRETPVATGAERLRMLQLAADANPGFVVDD
ncbi:MAG TPA: nicotinate-nicotinamide nucleotide adenylyltransferase, partial [Pseudomonadales bacterium]|nr:nicotinate-nicotinamide nucleotide adenylyltransferase [Pseudomonadales bacterium]